MDPSDAKPVKSARSRRYFTLPQANRALSLVRRIVADIIPLHREASARRERMDRLAQAGRTAELVEQRAALEDEVERLQGLVDELAEIGAQLKDWQMGLVDFPAMHQGREVLLCWRVGEERIDFWHEPSDGFAGRQPVELLDAACRGGD